MGKGHKKKKQSTSKNIPQEQKSAATAQQQQEPSTAQQQQEPSTAQQQQKTSKGPQQPQQVPQQGGGQSIPPQQQLPPRQQQQQHGPQGIQQQQQMPPGPQQQQHEPQGIQQQQQMPRGPQQQQHRPQGIQQQQQMPRGPQQQQHRPQGIQQQRQIPSGFQQQQGGPQVIQQQAQMPSGPQQQQQGPWGPLHQQGIHQQQQMPRGPQQQQQRPQGIQQQAQMPSGPQQQQQGPWGPLHRQGIHQQQQMPRGPQQQQQRPQGIQQQQQMPRGPQQQQHRPQGIQQQPQPPSGSQQQQPRPWGPRLQRGPQGPLHQQGIQQQRQIPPSLQEQHGGPQGIHQQAQMPSGSQQQQQLPQDPQQHKKEPQSSQKRQQKSQEPGQQQIAAYRGDTFNREKLTTAMQNMYWEQIPKRTSSTGGKRGRKITVETNMLKLILDKFQTCVVHYDVVIEPDKPKFLMRAVFEKYRMMHFPDRYPAFDGKKNAYSAKDLPFGDTSPEDEVQVFDVERQQNRSFKIHLNKAAILDLSWLKKINYGFMDLQCEQSGIQALDIILKHGSAYNCVNVGRSLFPHPEQGRVVPLSNGLDLWVGIFQSAVIGWKPYLNVDVAHKGFPTPQSVIDLMKDLCKSPRDEYPLQNITTADIDRNKDRITKYLKGLKIQYEIPGQSNSKRTYRVNELVKCPRENIFKLENGEKSSVEDYFIQQKKYRLRYPELPCLWVGSRNTERKIYLPVELCTIIAGQVIQRKMEDCQTSKLIKYAATDTQTRKKKIMNGFAKMKLNQQPTLMKEFNLSVSSNFEIVPARVLDPPQLQYSGQTPVVNVTKGVWRPTNFLKSCRLENDEWTILILDKYTNERTLRDELCSQLQGVGRSIGMFIGNAKSPFQYLNIQGRNSTSSLYEYFAKQKEKNVKLVVVIIPNVDTAYSLVKQISELRTVGGIVTQVIKAQTLRKLNLATVTNILLKINSKLNGINHQLARSPPCLQVPCILIGADVTHPSPDSTDIPSIAAVAASYSPSAFQYNIELRLQPPREEMILDLEEIMRIQLMFFYDNTKHKPQRIIFYRDGVSEGQLPQVMHFELAAIKRAISKMGAGQEKIPITFLVVQKRHHIRLFPTDRKNSDDKNFNVQAGTVVDTEITHPTHIDFYLVSHASIQGTARPTKYRCICNEIGMSEDEIEELTYYLCHMFARCTRSVSYPAPTYYAHLAAFRARTLINNVPLNMNNLAVEQKRKMTLQMQHSPMFFV